MIRCITCDLSSTRLWPSRSLRAGIHVHPPAGAVQTGTTGICAGQAPGTLSDVLHIAGDGFAISFVIKLSRLCRVDRPPTAELCRLPCRRTSTHLDAAMSDAPVDQFQPASPAADQRFLRESGPKAWISAQTNLARPLELRPRTADGWPAQFPAVKSLICRHQSLAQKVLALAAVRAGATGKRHCPWTFRQAKVGHCSLGWALRLAAMAFVTREVGQAEAMRSDAADVVAETADYQWLCASGQELRVDHPNSASNLPFEEWTDTFGRLDPARAPVRRSGNDIKHQSRADGG